MSVAEEPHTAKENKVKPIGKLIRKERERRKLGLCDLAALAGIEASTLLRIENLKTKDPGYMTVRKIETALECDFRRGL